MSGELRDEFEAQLASRMTAERLADREIGRWLDTAARAVQVVLAEALPLDAAVPAGSKVWT